MNQPRTPVFLDWLADRLINIYGENQNIDFVRRVREEAARSRTLLDNLSRNHDTYVLAETAEPPTLDGRKVYVLHRRGKPGAIGSKLRLTFQQSEDLARQLDAPIDYFND